MTTPLLTVRSITKTFGGPHEMDRAGLETDRREIRALCGGLGAARQWIY